jgi:hypothetical protein
MPGLHSQILQRRESLWLKQDEKRSHCHQMGQCLRVPFPGEWRLAAPYVIGRKMTSLVGRRRRAFVCYSGGARRTSFADWVNSLALGDWMHINDLTISRPLFCFFYFLPASCRTNSFLVDLLCDKHTQQWRTTFHFLNLSN